MENPVYPQFFIIPKTLTSYENKCIKSKQSPNKYYEFSNIMNKHVAAIIFYTKISERIMMLIFIFIMMFIRSKFSKKAVNSQLFQAAV